ncbi:hypothetical protein [Flagellimonas sp.]|uniref:hypothetical protein n=1 Tax=Flagellimonas sp. TaxID=2058762 RepID=UPI003BAAB1D3
MNYKEIISAVNKRYVLVKTLERYDIYDKLLGGLLQINDPIINYTELVKELKRRSTKVYSSIDQLPKPTRNFIDWKENKEVPSLNIVIRDMFNHENERTGVVVTYQSTKAIKNLKEKELIEKRLIDYIINNIFKNEGISIYKDIYRDTASIIAINNINELEFRFASIVL